MLPFITETETVWDKLETTKKTIVLYGMGNAADKILDWCEAKGVIVADIFASDDFVRGQVFRGYKICKYSDVVAKYDDLLIVIAFASESQAVLEHFFALAEKHETVVPHLALFAGDELVSFDWLKKYEGELRTVYAKLADEKSREVFAAILNYKLSGKLSFLREITTDRQEDFKQLYSFGEEETYIDLGAYDGDTIKEFLGFTAGKYREIIAVEPDRKNFKKLLRYVENSGLQRVETINKGIWLEAGTLNFTDSGGRQSALDTEGRCSVPVEAVDNILQQRPVSFIKLDVEGAEYEALLGAKESIRRWHPKLLVAVYHRDSDLWRLPQLLWQLNGNYLIYLRKHPYIPAWEINFMVTNQDNPEGRTGSTGV